MKLSTGLLKYFGILSFIIAFTGIGISISLNPWFNVWENALSDLGRIGIENSFIFNYTLIASSIFASIYSVYILKLLPNRIGCIGAGIYLVGTFSLAAIGLFPEGTKPHMFVSLEFFIIMTFSLFIFGISLMRSGKKLHGLALIAIFAASIGGSIAISWPSVALLELFNIFCYFSASYFYFSVKRNKNSSRVRGKKQR
ncbi:MAG: DUF998 domain-containing protein [Fervidicoccaceae archaeon]